MNDPEKTAPPPLPSPEGAPADYFAHALLEHAWSGLGVVDAAGTILFGTPAVARILGYPLAELVGRSAFDLLHPDDRPRIAHLFDQMRTQPGASLTAEFRYRHRAGAWLWVEVTGTNRLHDPGVRGVVLNYHDVTARRRAEEALRASEELTRQVLEAVPAGILEVDRAGAVVRANAAACRFLGRPWDDLGRRTLADFAGETIYEDGRPCPPDDYPVARCLRTGAAPAPATLGVRRPDGATFWGVFSALPVPTGAVVTFVDLTARKAREDRVRQADTRAAIDRLAGGVAHELNNLLTVIGGHGELLRDMVPAADPAAASVQAVCEAAARAAALARQLVAFSGQTLLAPRRVDLNALLRALEPELGRALGPAVACRLTCAPDLPPIEADADHLRQAVLDLAGNARDAMPRGGELAIGTAAVVLGGAAPPPAPDVRPGAYVRLSLADTGRGMDADVLAHLFEPFYTTKGVGRGLGLGAAAVYGFVRQSGGHVTADSAPGRGTTVCLYFPARPAAASPAAAATVLLAERDELVRTLAGRILAQHGYAVLPAATAAEALALCAAHPGPIDLVIVDTAGPAAGPPLARRLLACRPGLRLLYTSGSADPADLARLEAAAGVALPFLQKPYAPDDLLRAVRACLARP